MVSGDRLNHFLTASKRNSINSSIAESGRKINRPYARETYSIAESGRKKNRPYGRETYSRAESGRKKTDRIAGKTSYSIAEPER
jgi:hypothetical protein